MLKFTETVARDGNQSMIATRMTTDEILPILEKMDKAGYHSLEVWGGATFDSCIRYLNEDPWERLRKIRKAVKNTKLQMLIRGQNILGYKHYSDDIVEKFVERSIANGIDIIRIFDALNDFRNIKIAVDATKKNGGHAQICIAYTTSEIHTVEYYVEKTKEATKMGADSICIKDMSGILLPNIAYELITKMKEVTKVPIELHSHCTSGVASMTYMKAIEAGVDIIDTAISPFAGGTAQPATEVFAECTKEVPGNNLDANLLSDIAEYFAEIKVKYEKNGVFNPKVMNTVPKTLRYQVPGGMMSNLLSQLTDMKMEDKFEEVLKEIPNVRRDLGYPPLVTPLSQMVGAQSLVNVISGGRYKMIPKEIKEYAKGFYGRSPVKISKEIIDTLLTEAEQAEMISVRPADLMEADYENKEAECKELLAKKYDITTDRIMLSAEQVLAYTLFPNLFDKMFG